MDQRDTDEALPDLLIATPWASGLLLACGSEACCRWPGPARHTYNPGVGTCRRVADCGEVSEARPSVLVGKLLRNSEAMMLPGGGVWEGEARAASDLAAFLLMDGSCQCAGTSPAREVLDHSCRSLACFLVKVVVGGQWEGLGSVVLAGPKPPPAGMLTKVPDWNVGTPGSAGIGVVMIFSSSCSSRSWSQSWCLQSLILCISMSELAVAASCSRRSVSIWSSSSMSSW